jgi:hypothetical protein
VFFTWWQDLLISALVHLKLIKQMDLDGTGNGTVEEVASLISNFVICIEMLVMAEGYFDV